ncbi:MAG: GNAT family N-acetyltransferase [Bacteroidota bacterium]
MIRANYPEKELVIDILSESFDANQSVNYIAQQDNRRIKRIRALMDYSFEVCHSFGEVFLSDDKKACALVLFPDQKRTTLKSIFLDIKLIFSCIGIGNIFKALKRESKIKNLQPKETMFYLWFIGVKPEYQNTGIGMNLLDEIIKHSEAMERPIYLETSTTSNLPWYKKFGFEIYNELDLGYKLFFLKRKLGFGNDR